LCVSYKKVLTMPGTKRKRAKGGGSSSHDLKFLSDPLGE
jgi:hypothetical protein